MKENPGSTEQSPHHTDHNGRDNHSQSIGDVDNTTSPSSSHAKTHNEHDHAEKGGRSRKMSEPSGTRSHRDSRRSRQDSVSSTGFGSSHFGSSSLKRKGSVSSSQRINIVADAASIVPTPSIDHFPDFDELCPNYDLENDDGTELGHLKTDADDTMGAGTEDRWSQKLPNIPESEALNQAGNGLAKPAIGDDDDMSPEEIEEYRRLERKKYMKNLLVLCIGFFFLFTAFLSLRNLQSSLNAKGGLGLYALSANYACFFMGCIMATTIVQRLGPKRAIVVATTGPLLYVIANFYPLFYTLIPAAGCAGFCQGVIWTGHATYIANIAAAYTEVSNEKIQDVLSRFNGIFFVFYQSCQIVGGLISSIVLKSPEEPLLGYLMNGTMLNGTMFNGTMFNESMYGNESFPNYYYHQNMTLVRDYSHCGKNYCPYTSGLKGAAPVERKLVFILVGIFTASCLAGIFVLAFLLDRLEGQMKKKKANIGKQLLAVFKFYYNRYAICLVGLMFYTLLQAAFMFGEYNKAFVTCTLGIHMVGFVMMTLSSSSAIAAFVNGKIQKWTTRPPLVATGVTLQIIVFLTLLSWMPTPEDKPVFFILVVLWGIGDGIIMTQDISIIGFLFSDNKEPAFAALKMTQSIANFTFFMMAPYLCTVQKIAFVFTVLLIATTGYFCLEVLMYCERRQKKKKEKLQNPVEPVKT